MKFCGACDRIKSWGDFRTKGSSNCRHCEEQIARRKRDDRVMFSYNSYRSWSALDDARLLTLAAIGVPLNAMAILLQRPVEGTRVHLRELNGTLVKPLRQWPPERIADLRDMIAVQGLSRSQAAKALGVTKNAVISATQRHLPQLSKKRQARVGI